MGRGAWGESPSGSEAEEEEEEKSSAKDFSEESTPASYESEEDSPADSDAWRERTARKKRRKNRDDHKVTKQRRVRTGFEVTMTDPHDRYHVGTPPSRSSWVSITARRSGSCARGA